MYRKILSIILIIIIVSSGITGSNYIQITYGDGNPNAVIGPIVSLNESLPMTDSTVMYSNAIIQLNTSNLNSSQTTSNGTITVKTSYVSPVPGATYIVSPNPKTGSGNLTITDGAIGDEDGLANGIIKISKVPMGKYVIAQVNIPPGFHSLLGSAVTNVKRSHLDQIVTFPVLPSITDPTQLSPTPIQAPSLNADAFNKWRSSFSARIVSNVNSSILLNNEDQTPQTILAGSRNSSAISTSIILQSSVLLNTSFAPLTSGSTIINTIGLENYSLPNSTYVVAIIPTIVTSVNTTSGYIAATPPISGVTLGQEMIIPVADSLIPSFGGLKEITVQSSPLANPTGVNNTNWFVAEVENNIPSTISSIGINNAPILFIDLQHPFEENRAGFNWSNASNFAAAPTLTIIVNKNSSSSILNDSVGCPIVDAYTLVSGSWTTLGVGEASSKSVSLSKCEITINSQHLSKFAFSLKHLSSLTSSAGLSGTGKASGGTNIYRYSNFADATSSPNSAVSNSQYSSKFAFSLKHLSSLTSSAGLSGTGKASGGTNVYRNSNLAAAISSPNTSTPTTQPNTSAFTNKSSTPTTPSTASTPTTPSTASTPTTPSTASIPTPSTASTPTTPSTASTPTTPSTASTPTKPENVLDLLMNVIDLLMKTLGLG